VTAERLARLTARISGRVQGVGYRFFAVDEALARSLVGYARNLPDGDVEVVAEGPRAVLEDFVSVLATGPRSARVDRVQPAWAEPRGESEDFHIRF
jgi:acylphosphatase